MTLPDIILMVDYQSNRDKSRDEREAALDTAAKDILLAAQMQAVFEAMAEADGVAR